MAATSTSSSLITTDRILVIMGLWDSGRNVYGKHSHGEQKTSEVTDGFDQLFQKRFAAVIPETTSMGIHHISTHPKRCEPLYTSLPGHGEEETWCEKHFLVMSIPAKVSHLGDIPVYGLEILIYKTEHLTTVFVSKADSTGLMHYRKWPRSTPISPMKALATTFLRLLADTQQREDRRLVVSLFARSQRTYIFPGSGEYEEKHVLDDAGLIKWWAQVMDMVMDLNGNDVEDKITLNRSDEATTARVQIYCRIPGYSAREIRPFVPRNTNEKSPFRTALLAEDPFQMLAFRPGLPARCMVPHFYDDPKTRFAEELDGYDKVSDNGNWSSVPSLNAFWDLMQYRQECAAGRLVGFLWGVFTPKGLTCEAEAVVDPTSLPPPQHSDVPPVQSVPREGSAFHDSPDYALGNVILTHEEYESVQEVLARGDFSNHDAAIETMVDWIEKIKQLTGGIFGFVCSGKASMLGKSDQKELKPEIEHVSPKVSQTEATESRRKRTINYLSTDHAVLTEVETTTQSIKPSHNVVESLPPVKTLSGGMIRKKPKLG